MAKNKPTKQHYVPQCYLREFVDKKTASKKDPIVWVFDKDGKNRRKDKVKNVLASNDLYTLKFNGHKSYVIEETLANLEMRYAQIFRENIQNNLPLNEEEHIILCAFVSAMLMRTLRQKDHMERNIDEIIDLMESLERAHNAEPKQSQELRKQKENFHKLSVVNLLPDITKLLLKMNVAFLCAKPGAKFITSDNPCFMYNPDLQWQQLYGPGLAQKKVEVSIPLSPEIKLCLSWSNLRGYIYLEKKQVEESNRMTVGHSYKYIISNNGVIKRMWFRNYPMDFIHIMKIIRHKLDMFFIKP